MDRFIAGDYELTDIGMEVTGFDTEKVYKYIKEFTSMMSYEITGVETPNSITVVHMNVSHVDYLSFLVNEDYVIDEYITYTLADKIADGMSIDDAYVDICYHTMDILPEFNKYVVTDECVAYVALVDGEYQCLNYEELTELVTGDVSKGITYIYNQLTEGDEENDTSD